MRPLFIGVMLAALARVGHAAHEPQQPTDVFRGRVDLITIDVSALDSKGKPVEDLRDRDFTVKIDGNPRSVVSAELIKVDQARIPPAVRPADALITTNAAVRDARRVVIAVDQTLIEPGSITPLLRTASGFVDRLVPSDFAAFIGFPEPGPRVDFTNDHARVRKAMDTIVGHPAKRGGRQFNITMWEAFELTSSERSVASDSKHSGPNLDGSFPRGMLLAKMSEPPTMQRVFERGCEGLTYEELAPADRADIDAIRLASERIERCRVMIFHESMRVAADARQDATISLRALENLLKDLALIDGPKTMLVISAGLVNDDPSVLDGVAQLAAAARTTIHVIAVNHEPEQEIRSLGANQTGMTLVDRSFEMQGLEIIADRTGGSLYRAPAGTSQGVFQRIESELSAWYVLAVERQPGDPDQQRISVEVKRKGVTVRSNKTFVSTASVNAKRPMEEVLRDALSSSLALPGIPLRVATFAQRDTAPGNYRLRLAAQIGQSGEKPAEFAVGYALMGENGRPVTTAGSRRMLNPPPGGANQPLNYESALSVGPGVYSLRVGVVDREGRRGTVVHRVELPQLTGDEIGTSDLIVGRLPGTGETLGPSVEPQVTTGELAGYLELYLSDADRDHVTVTLEIAEGESSPALAAEPLSLRAGEQPSWRIASGYVDVAAAPGRYVARAIVRRDGSVVRTLTRAVTIARDPAVVAKSPPLPRGLPVSVDLRQRTAAYVASMVTGLANLVAQEEFTLSKPDRRVTSDLLLVRYPGTQRDLIPYRDASHLNGAAIPGREERLLDLFVKPTDAALRERARRIMAGADAFVPTVFNPMFVLGFLQSDFQSRFELTVSDADSDWPREVKAVTFVETVRPTLLRTGVFADIDVPTRGTAWIEAATGRVLQTELQVGRGGSTPKMITKFRLDERLQVTVPIEMRTQNPDGIATYANFRRFGVETDTKIPPPPTPNH